MQVKITFYGYPDNDDGEHHFGTAVVAHQLEWQGRSRYTDEKGLPFASGTGTFDDPITAAASTGNRVFPPGTLVYIPGLKKYFLVEDECESCSDEAWLDLWMESNSASEAWVVENCESEWTGDDTFPRQIVIDPPPDLEVDPSPFIDSSTGTCRAVAWSGREENPDPSQPERFDLSVGNGHVIETRPIGAKTIADACSVTLLRSADRTILRAAFDPHVCCFFAREALCEAGCDGEDGMDGGRKSHQSAKAKP